MELTKQHPGLGQGLYTFSEAARILRNAVEPVSASTLRRWTTSGLVSPASVTAAGEPLLNFDDLVSLEVIRRFRREHVSLPSIRRLEEELRLRHQLARPFAYQIFYTDGADVWAKVAGPDGTMHLIEIRGRRPNHYVWVGAIETFATQIDFGEDGRAEVWRPSRWVEINPHLQFGAPVVAGTRIPVSTIAAQLRAATPEDVARWYDLEPEQVRGVQEYVAVGA